ncbi:hypothetical protein C5S53_09465 [Methanophagales archaeon]|nr:hypothetical protein C5S53_09465 [Methanophagales archaeon]
MKLEDQVASLELAKELKELGVKQDSIFYWWRSQDMGWLLLYNPATIYRTEAYSAFTVGELGEMLPSNAHFFVATEHSKYLAYCDAHKEVAITEADARAKLLIFLRSGRSDGDIRAKEAIKRGIKA